MYNNIFGEKCIAFAKKNKTVNKQWKSLTKMNVDVGINSEKCNETRQGWVRKNMSAKDGKVLITFLHCHSKLLDNVRMSDQ